MSHLYFAAEGLAWTKGVDEFKKVMPLVRFKKLYYSVIEAKGRKWADIHFLSWIVTVAYREERATC